MNKLDKEYEKDKEVEVDYQLRLPGVIPSISVQMKMNFYNE